MRKWNLLLSGAKNGLVGAINDHHNSAPRHLERVKVVEIRELVERLNRCEYSDDLGVLISDLERMVP